MNCFTSSFPKITAFSVEATCLIDTFGLGDVFPQPETDNFNRKLMTYDRFQYSTLPKSAYFNMKWLEKEP